MVEKKISVYRFTMSQIKKNWHNFGFVTKLGYGIKLVQEMFGEIFQQTFEDTKVKENKT